MKKIVQAEFKSLIRLGGGIRNRAVGAKPPKNMRDESISILEMDVKKLIAKGMAKK